MANTVLKVPGGPGNIVRVDREGDTYRLIIFTGGRHPYKDTILDKNQLKSLAYGLVDIINRMS